MLCSKSVICKYKVQTQHKKIIWTVLLTYWLFSEKRQDSSICSSEPVHAHRSTLTSPKPLLSTQSHTVRCRLVGFSSLYQWWCICTFTSIHHLHPDFHKVVTITSFPSFSQKLLLHPVILTCCKSLHLALFTSTQTFLEVVECTM